MASASAGAAPAAWWLLVTAVNTVDAAVTASAPPKYWDKLEMPGLPVIAATRRTQQHVPGMAFEMIAPD